MTSPKVSSVPPSSAKTTATNSASTKTSRHATRYFFVGITLTVFNFGAYTLLNLIFLGIKLTDTTASENEQYLWLTTLISTALTTILAYLMHSRITWKERSITKHSVIRFFIWNALITVAINPGLTQLFSLFTPLYQFAYGIIMWLHLPFSYDFTVSTGAFVLTAIVVMVLNFLFYDRFVFGKVKPQSSARPTPKIESTH